MNFIVAANQVLKTIKYSARSLHGLSYIFSCVAICILTLVSCEEVPDSQTAQAQSSLQASQLQTSHIQTTSSSAELITDNVELHKPPVALDSFQLVDFNGRVFTNNRLTKHWSFLFVGFMSCPDICPTTLYELAKVYPELKAIDDTSQIIFISIDPNRDKPADLKLYTEFFNHEFIAVTGTHPNLQSLVRQLSLVYSITEMPSKISSIKNNTDYVSGSEPDTEYSIDYQVTHSASLVVINPAGEIAAHLYPDMNLQVPQVEFNKLPEILQYLKNKK